MLFKRKKYTLSAREMIEMEEWLAKNCFPLMEENASEEDLSVRLKLKVEYVSPSVLAEHVEAELIPIDEYEYNGLIRVNTVCKGKSFAYLHEIIHYIHDIGIGNKVNKVFKRMSKGHTESKHEQKINYMTAAVKMPYDKIAPQIRKYDMSRPKMDELKFVGDLCVEFGQSRAAIIRRIREVRRIENPKMPHNTASLHILRKRSIGTN